ncbi:hypothetical protein D6445_11810 [Salmonella enterica subsp. enterica serovar Infantis]|nr:hypothetical protein [Salmonella enterica subsp. enterica serovar Infantis]
MQQQQQYRQPEPGVIVTTGKKTVELAQPGSFNIDTPFRHQRQNLCRQSGHGGGGDQRGIQLRIKTVYPLSGAPGGQTGQSSGILRHEMKIVTSPPVPADQPDNFSHRDKAPVRPAGPGA